MTDLPMRAVFFDGPWSGMEIDMVVPFTHLLIGTLGDGAEADRTRSVLRYEVDQMSERWTEKDGEHIECRFVLARDNEEFNLEIAELVELAP